MAEFINTSVVIGDDALVDSIIQRTITEYKEDRITKVAEYAFYGCAALTTVDLPNVIDIDSYAFRNCAALERVDLSSVSNIYSFSFHTCSALKALIIRRTDIVARLSATTALQQSAIALGTGYIYVPAALVEEYKKTTGWANWGDQFRALEDYTVDGTTTGELDETKI